MKSAYQELQKKSYCGKSNGIHCAVSSHSVPTYHKLLQELADESKFEVTYVDLLESTYTGSVFIFGIIGHHLKISAFLEAWCYFKGEFHVVFQRFLGSVLHSAWQPGSMLGQGDTNDIVIIWRMFCISSLAQHCPVLYLAGSCALFEWEEHHLLPTWATPSTQLYQWSDLCMLHHSRPTPHSADAHFNVSTVMLCMRWSDRLECILCDHVHACSWNLHAILLEML